MSEPLCGWCYSEYKEGSFCCEKMDYENTKIKLSKREDDYRKLRERSDELIEDLKRQSAEALKLAEDALGRWSDCDTWGSYTSGINVKLLNYDEDGDFFIQEGLITEYFDPCDILELVRHLQRQLAVAREYLCCYDLLEDFNKWKQLKSEAESE